MTPKVEVRDLSTCRKELVIEVPAEDVRPEWERVYGDLARRLTVPGFRPGRVPISVARQRFKREAQQELGRRLIPLLIEQAVAAYQWRLAAEPEVSTFSVSETEPLRLHARVEVFPEITVTGYRGMRAQRRVRPVTEEEIDEALEHLRASQAVLIPVEDRPAAPGDVVTVLVTAEESDPRGRILRRLSERQEMTLELSAEAIGRDPFARELVGLASGETKVFTLEDASGRSIRYTVVVTDVRRTELPELDDEFARAVSQRAETLAELREQIRQHVERRHAEEADADLREQLLDRLIEAHPFEVPPSIVERRARRRLEHTVRALLEAGRAPDPATLEWEQLVRRHLQVAEREVRAELILDRIAEQEGVEVSDAEVEAEIARWAAHRGISVAELRDRLTTGGTLDSIKTEMRRRKALELVVANAVVETHEAPPEREGM